jgi:hypothetical protein
MDASTIVLGPSTLSIQCNSDWCHVCGERADTKFACFGISENAEHDRLKKKAPQVRAYRSVRICKTCIDTAALVMKPSGGNA